MSIVIKICGMRDKATIEAAIDAGANAIGFVFAASPREIAPADAHEAAQVIPKGVARVAVMRHPSNERWQHVLRTVEPDVLQTDYEDFESLDVPAHVRTWPVVREGDTVTDWPDEFVYEGRRSGAGETVDWQRAAEIAGNGRMVLAGGLDSENVATAIASANPWGVDVSSGVESGPGIKDAGKIREFIRAVRATETKT